jgi:hypothetical protein
VGRRSGSEFAEVSFERLRVPKLPRRGLSRQRGEIAEALASVDVSGRDPEWRAEWAELIEAVRRAAQ